MVLLHPAGGGEHDGAADGPEPTRADYFGGAQTTSAVVRTTAARIRRTIRVESRVTAAVVRSVERRGDAFSGRRRNWRLAVRAADSAPSSTRAQPPFRSTAPPPTCPGEYQRTPTPEFKFANWIRGNIPSFLKICKFSQQYNF
jgi:hypothetical protein